MGSKLCPPANNLASEPSWPNKVTASLTERGAWYSKRGGIMFVSCILGFAFDIYQGH
jgi:hypothetical protein